MAGATTPIRTIVVGYDGTDGARAALVRAAELAVALSARLVVARIDDVATIYPPAAPAAYGAPLADFGAAHVPAVGEPDPLRERVDAAIERDLDEARQTLSGSGVTADYTRRQGPAAAALIDVADELQAELLVVGTREPGFLERLFVGSVSGEVARSAHCDVLVVHHSGEAAKTADNTPTSA